jgi:hypothetical protein
LLVRLFLVDASYFVASGFAVEELHEMTARIEKLSESEHNLISEVHPQVGEIKEHVENVRDAVSPEKS